LSFSSARAGANRLPGLPWFIAATPEYVRSRHERKKVEMLFAHLKRILKLDRLRLRGMSDATDEFTLAAAVQNLRRLAKFTSQGPLVTG
jgi:hypothetical protein